MRVCESKMLSAIAEKSDRKCGDNTEVTYYDGVCDVFLFGNNIATVGDGFVSVRDCNWRTSTTKSRLNAILRKYSLPTIHQKDHVWYVGDEVWRGFLTVSF